ncbi:hypothetical protein MYCTH_2306775 [Thermothelomyces thermophilus ATCC 42464]|uniref:Uncharacterized protein n=1 Tax=Thermothelomyces thermophilus (strain ATCC 42464 / BCRC 31852 / DSM 1799) TaxID=573729 RepID=G2QET6_THET4|nr:uncharacterized protein MYCTH_2306775 [Thermothelomyces thermophilus ATCC 42464]AEO58965.1 hypothetical protein MYCTH_2306775 [Thermothelomyces thermophilus ATCC 42464]
MFERATGGRGLFVKIVQYPGVASVANGSSIAGVEWRKTVATLERDREVGTLAW